MTEKTANEILRIDRQIEFLLRASLKPDFWNREDVDSLIDLLKQEKLRIYDNSNRFRRYDSG